MGVLHTISVLGAWITLNKKRHRPLSGLTLQYQGQKTNKKHFSYKVINTMEKRKGTDKRV